VCSVSLSWWRETWLTRVRRCSMLCRRCSVLTLIVMGDIKKQRARSSRHTLHQCAMHTATHCNTLQHTATRLSKAHTHIIKTSRNSAHAHQGSSECILSMIHTYQNERTHATWYTHMFVSRDTHTWWEGIMMWHMLPDTHTCYVIHTHATWYTHMLRHTWSYPLYTHMMLPLWWASLCS